MLEDIGVAVLDYANRGVYTEVTEYDLTLTAAAAILVFARADGTGRASMLAEAGQHMEMLRSLGVPGLECADA
jgi:hypothetical protein